MALIERETIKKRVKQSTVSNPIKAAMEVFINTAPTIDPIHAAGGCRCGECGFKDTFDCPAAKNGYTFPAMEHCSYGEPREAQDDG